jgi:hypothetical protein
MSTASSVLTLPTYKQQQHRAVQIYYTANKQQIPSFINSLYILSHNISYYYFQWVEIYIFLIIL